MLSFLNISCQAEEIDEQDRRTEDYLQRQKSTKETIKAIRQAPLSRNISQRRSRLRRWKALRSQLASERRHMDLVDREIDAHKKVLHEQYGFVADPCLPLWENVELQLSKVDVTKLLARPQNTACHNLLQSRPLLDGTPQLLGLGLNYCEIG